MPATPTGIALLSCLRRARSPAEPPEVTEQYLTEDEEKAALRWQQNYVREHHAFATLRTFRRHTGIATTITQEPRPITWPAAGSGRCTKRLAPSSTKSRGPWSLATRINYSIQRRDRGVRR